MVVSSFPRQPDAPVLSFGQAQVLWWVRDIWSQEREHEHSTWSGLCPQPSPGAGQPPSLCPVCWVRCPHVMALRSWSQRRLFYVCPLLGLTATTHPVSRAALTTCQHSWGAVLAPSLDLGSDQEWAGLLCWKRKGWPWKTLRPTEETELAMTNFKC